MDKLEKTIELFRKLPGIGPRQARRIVNVLLNNKPLAKSLSLEIDDLDQVVVKCLDCHRFFAKNHGVSVCKICNNKERDTSFLMVVERDSDLDSVEKSGVYKGLYFVLDGVIPILSKDPEKLINFNLLQKRVSNNPPTEIILALSATPEGENTIDYIIENLKSEIKNQGIKVTVLGRGLSTGTELEYADSETLKGALQNRH